MRKTSGACGSRSLVLLVVTLACASSQAYPKQLYGGEGIPAITQGGDPLGGAGGQSGEPSLSEGTEGAANGEEVSLFPQGMESGVVANPGGGVEAHKARRDATAPKEGVRVVSLQDAQELASEHNRDLAILRARLDQVRASAGKAWAAVLPALMLQASWRRLDSVPEYDFSSFERMGAILEEVAAMVCAADPANEICLQPTNGGGASSGGSGGLGIEPRLNTISGTANLTVPLVNPSGYMGIKSANRMVASVVENTDHARREILFAVSQAYYGALMAEEMARIAERTVEAREAHLEVARAQVEAGEQPRVAQLRAEIQVVVAEKDLEQALASTRKSKNVLANLLRLEGPFLLVRPNISGLDIATDPEELTQRALENRQDLQGSRRRLEAAQYALRQSRYSYLPQVAANATFNVDNAKDSRGSDSPFSWVLVVSANLPVFQGGLKIRDIQEKRASLVEAELSYWQLREQIATDALNALEDLSTARVVSQTSSRQVELARENSRLVAVSFAAGMARPVDVVDADTGLYAAEIAALRDELSVELASLAISRLAGRFPH